MTAFLETRAINKAYGGLQAVRNCSIVVKEGSITSLIGPNGAGKTTAFDIINGVVSADSGSVIFNGTDVTGLFPHKLTRMGMSRTFQLTRDLREMTVLENMVVGSPARGIRSLIGSKIQRGERERAMDLLDFVGITHLANTAATKLSYGQKKLLEFASVLMSEPKLVLLDEPAGGVNPALLERIVDRVAALNRSGITFLLVEHKMDMVMQLSDWVIVMAHGELLAEGTPTEIQGNDIVLDAYLGRA